MNINEVLRIDEINEPSVKNDLAVLLRRLSDTPTHELASSLMRSKPYANSYKMLVFAFNATLLNTRN